MASSLVNIDLICSFVDEELSCLRVGIILPRLVVEILQLNVVGLLEIIILHDLPPPPGIVGGGGVHAGDVHDDVVSPPLVTAHCLELLPRPEDAASPVVSQSTIQLLPQSDLVTHRHRGFADSIRGID